jgi:UDP-glucose:(heptosyl)LPS alpha-1,3-glucosyltransferase
VKYPDEIALVRSTWASFGGVERVALSLINGLLQKGVRIRVLTMPRQQWPLSDSNLEIVHLGLSRGHRLLKAWAFNRAVNRHLNCHPCDCILSLDKVTRFTHLHAGGGTHKTFLDIKKRYSSPISRLFLKLSLFHRYMIYLERKGFESPGLKKVRCNSQMVMDVIERDYGVDRSKLVLVHSGIRWKEMQETYRRREAVGRALCRENGFDPNWKSLLFLGSGFLHKGLDIAIRGLHAMSPDYHLVVVGKGATRIYHRLAASLGLAGRIHFLGPQPKGWRYASFCKAVVLPSHYDPFGGASAEGHAMGLPVLVSDMTGYADWVIQGENGIILKTPMSAQRIRESFAALEKIIEQPAWSSDRLRNHARNVDDDIILDQLLEKFFQTA